MKQKIQAKFNLLPGDKQEEIINSIARDFPGIRENMGQLPEWILGELPDMGTNFDAKTGFATWLANPDNWLFLPFVWDAIDYYVYQQFKKSAREELANQIVALLKHNPHPPRSIRVHLQYANFSHMNLSGVNMRGADLTGANLSDAISVKGANFINCTGVGTNFRGIFDLEFEQIMSLGDLYKTKFPFQFKKLDEKNIRTLEEKIIQSYRDELDIKYTPTSECTLKDREQKLLMIDSLLQLIRLSDFSPLDWADEGEFQQKFDALYKNQAEVLDILKQKIDKVVRENDGTYYRDRLDTQDLKSFWKPAPCASREGQIGRLQNLVDPEKGSTNLGEVIAVLASVKAEIKKEWNIWDSELLKKINQLVKETINETVNPPASPASISSQKT